MRILEGANVGYVMGETEGPAKGNSEHGTGASLSQSLQERAFTCSLDNKTHKNNLLIRKTCPCKEYPLKPLFYLVKLGYAGVYLFFLLCSKTEIVGTR